MSKQDTKPTPQDAEITGAKPFDLLSHLEAMKQETKDITSWSYYRLPDCPLVFTKESLFELAKRTEKYLRREIMIAQGNALRSESLIVRADDVNESYASESWNPK